MLNYKRRLLPGETRAIVQGGGRLMFGIDQDHPNILMPISSFCGDLIDARLYNMLLSVEDMLNYGNCRSMTLTDKPVVDFNDMGLFQQGKPVTVSQAPQDSTCIRKTEPFHLLFLEERTFASSVLLCHASGGTLSLPINDEENLEMIELGIKYGEHCGKHNVESFWLGLQADIKNNMWVHYRTKLPLAYMRFPAEYNYMTEEMSCAAISKMSAASSYWFARWYPSDCGTSQWCTMCDYEDIVMFKLRGLCQKSQFDRKYVLVGPQEGKPSFLGVFFSRIVWRPSDAGSNTSFTAGHWILIDDKRKDLYGWMETSVNEYPIGRKKWNMTHDKCDRTEVDLMLTRCGEDEFTCDDGSCVPLVDRCDLSIHCDDSSDEYNCQVC